MFCNGFSSAKIDWIRQMLFIAMAIWLAILYKIFSESVALVGGEQVRFQKSAMGAVSGSRAKQKSLTLIGSGFLCPIWSKDQKKSLHLKLERFLCPNSSEGQKNKEKLEQSLCPNFLVLRKWKPYSASQMPMGGGLFSIQVQKPVSKELKTCYFSVSACQLRGL